MNKEFTQKLSAAISELVAAHVAEAMSEAARGVDDGSVVWSGVSPIEAAEATLSEILEGIPTGE